MLFTLLHRFDRNPQFLLAKILSKSLQAAIIGFTILLLLTGTSGCSREFVRSLQGVMQQEALTAKRLSSFQQILVSDYQEQNIKVRLNDVSTEQGWIREIWVEFTNTAWNELTDVERAKTAEEITRSAADYFSMADPEVAVVVRFVDSRKYGILTYSRVIDSYTLQLGDVA
ncbi:MAG: hypothetical protein Kow00121_58750 [Elainellaceae cyanobacterium]